jgi:hypothetical protein
MADGLNIPKNKWYRDSLNQKIYIEFKEIVRATSAASSILSAIGITYTSTGIEVKNAPERA